MRLSELLKSAFFSIWSRKVRSFLTSLGVIIGVFAVSALLSVGQASINQMNESMSDLNADIIDINLNNDEVNLSLSYINSLSDYESIQSVAPQITTSGELEKGNNSTNAKIVATTDAYKDVKDLSLSKGRFISKVDVDNKSKSVVLGLTKCLEMYSTYDVIGQRLYLNNIEFTIIGVLAEQKASLMINPNKEVYIPITTGQAYFDLGNIRNIAVLSKEDMTDEANNNIKIFLNEKYESKDDYYISSAEDIQNYIQESNKTMMALLGGIGGISLLVSGIGIMNIMLVSVRERTKEIGIRKSVGAKRKDILIQFLIEAMGLSLFGGIIGIILTFISTNVLGNAMDLTIIVEPWIILLSTVFSLVVGIVFGLYPAMKASNLKPVEALHYE